MPGQGYSEDGIKVLACTFGEQWLEISFVEERDESDDVIDIKQRLVSPMLFRDEVADIQDSLVELLIGPRFTVAVLPGITAGFLQRSKKGR